jgi:hypothetical protein
MAMSIRVIGDEQDAILPTKRNGIIAHTGIMCGCIRGSDPSRRIPTKAQNDN